MLRTLIILTGCFLATLAADLLFRASLFESVRPVILTPPTGKVLTPPVSLEWRGPERMRILVAPTGGEPRDLGIQTGPLVLPPATFPREGSYEVRIVSPRLGAWIEARRTFLVHVPPEVPASAPEVKTSDDPFDRPVRMTDLLRALRAARMARVKSNDRARALLEENLAQREESEKLVQQLEALGDAQEEDAEQIADLERRLAMLGNENRALIEELATLRARLASGAACTLWGYYSFPRPNTVPPTKRLLLISDLRGEVFHTQPECELARRTDSSSGSLCFCVGAAWG